MIGIILIKSKFLPDGMVRSYLFSMLALRHLVTYTFYYGLLFFVTSGRTIAQQLL